MKDAGFGGESGSEAGAIGDLSGDTVEDGAESGVGGLCGEDLEGTEERDAGIELVGEEGEGGGESGWGYAFASTAVVGAFVEREGDHGGRGELLEGIGACVGEQRAWDALATGIDGDVLELGHGGIVGCDSGREPEKTRERWLLRGKLREMGGSVAKREQWIAAFCDSEV
jgi:hypothetical protein